MSVIEGRERKNIFKRLIKSIKLGLEEGYRNHVLTTQKLSKQTWNHKAFHNPLRKESKKQQHSPARNTFFLTPTNYPRAPPRKIYLPRRDIDCKNQSPIKNDKNAGYPHPTPATSPSYRGLYKSNKTHLLPRVQELQKKKKKKIPSHHHHEPVTSLHCTNIRLLTALCNRCSVAMCCCCCCCCSRKRSSAKLHFFRNGARFFFQRFFFLSLLFTWRIFFQYVAFKILSYGRQSFLQSAQALIT